MRPLRELLLGARMALAGGVSGWLRAGLAALGVGLGVMMLLLAASVPQASAARNAREAARTALTVTADGSPPRSDTTMVVEHRNTEFRDRRINGLVLQPDGARPPLPPGVAALPGPGELVVSPALARLLGSPTAAPLRDRLNYPIVGTIADEGLAGPNELFFYLGADDLTVSDDPLDGSAARIDSFGSMRETGEFDPALALVVVAIVVVLLMPIGLFVAAAIRFGGEARDRRLAGVRLLGADAQMARRIAAGEALTSSLFGLLVGAALFLVGRSLADRFEVNGLSPFPADLSPDPAITVLLVVGLPAVAVLITIASMRRALIEPLSVTRRAGDVRRRLWWRLLLPMLGILLLVPLFGDLAEGGETNPIQVGAGLSLILIGVAVLLPWLVQVTIGRLRGGPVGWQLAVRRLQLDSSTPARAVMGIAVAVAGAVGLQTVYGSVAVGYSTATGADVARADASISFRVDRGWDGVRAFDAALLNTSGIGNIRSSLTLPLSGGESADPSRRSYSSLIVGECATLREYAEIGSCTEGDVFLIDPEGAGSVCDSEGCRPTGWAPAPGEQVQVDGVGTAAPQHWTVPAGARVVSSRSSPGGLDATGVLATPSAVPAELIASHGRWGQSYVDIDQLDAGAVERLRTVAWHWSSGAFVNPLVGAYEDDQLVALRRGLLAGATATLLLIGVSLLVSVIEQLRERRQVLASLVAFGTRRRTLAWSILWQAVVPVALGLLLAVGAGIAVGTAVLKIAGEPAYYDWGVVGLVCGVAAAVVLGVTGLSLPVLWRLMRADGLRTE